MDANISNNIKNLDRRKIVRRKNRKVVLRLILLQLVLLAIASHYAHAQLYGIMKYYLLELSAGFCFVCVIVYINDAIQKRKKVHWKEKSKEPLQCCPVDGTEHTNDVPRVYNYNWIIKDESKKDIEQEDIKKESVSKEEVTKQVYKSPFDGVVHTDKKVLYKSPFDSIERGRVMIVLDSAKDDDKYVLSRDKRYYGTYRRVVKDKYILSLDERYCGRFHYAIKDKYVLSSDKRYCGRFYYVIEDNCKKREYTTMEDDKLSRLVRTK